MIVVLQLDYILWGFWGITHGDKGETSDQREGVEYDLKDVIPPSRVKFWGAAKK